MYGDASTAQTSFNFRPSDYQNAVAEEEQDKILEEEEFSSLQDCGGDNVYLPLAHRLAGKADALDMELRRIRWALLERRQLLLDTRGATLMRRPTRADHALASALVDQRQGLNGAALTREEPLTASHLDSYSRWLGSSSLLVRLVCAWLLGISSMRSRPPARRAPPAGGMAPDSSKALVKLTEDLDYIRRVRSYHALNYYSRMILTPKRHIGHGVYVVLWNLWIGLQNAVGCVLFGTLREVKHRGWVRGVPAGLLKGSCTGLKFLGYGWVVSPCIHLSCSLTNSLYGPMNFFNGRYFFDALSGRWMRCTVADTRLLRYALQREKRLIRAIGRMEFKRKQMQSEEKWTQRLADMGFSIEGLREKFKDAKGGGGSAACRAAKDMPNPYEVLGLKRSASQREIKAQYKKLAMVFHPDVLASGRYGGAPSAEERRDARSKFESISSAYQILSNREKRKAYDMGGVHAVSLHDSKYGVFLARTQEEMVQSIFGGEAFRRTLVGELLRSHWALRNEAQVSVSLHEFEELQCIRVRQLALELAGIVDVHAKALLSETFRAGPATPAAAHPSSSSGAPRRVVQSSSLPDPLGRGRVSGGGRGGTRDNLLPQSKAGSSPAAARIGEGASRGCPPQPAAPEDAAAPKLHPGSNAYNCFSKDFENRCDRFIDRLGEACFGPELLHELGEAYVTSAQRFLRVRSFYAPKALLNRKIILGFDRIFAAFMEKGKMEGSQLARRIMMEYFSMEYDNVVADLHVVLRFAVQLVLQDVSECAEVRQRRCYAVWLLGEKMRLRGSPWNSVKRNDADLMAYVQQAANSVATTSKPPTF